MLGKVHRLGQIQNNNLAVKGSPSYFSVTPVDVMLLLLLLLSWGGLSVFQNKLSDK